MRTDGISDSDLQGHCFGRKGVSPAAAIAARSTIASDIKLFALTFAGGFLFMAVYLA